MYVSYFHLFFLFISIAGRTDASAAHTDAASFDVLEPVQDGFRNHLPDLPGTLSFSPEASFVEKSSMLNLTKAEMTVLVGGMRVLGGNTGNTDVGVFTSTPGALTNDFFVHLLDMHTEWTEMEVCFLLIHFQPLLIY